MSLTNDIYKKIDVETDACVESTYDFWELTARSKIRPTCYKKAYNKYYAELHGAQLESYTIDKQLNNKTIESLNNNITDNPLISITALIVAIIIIYLIFF